ncbi:hypothetical protein BDW62DRAFT_211490 [Aspergillus aurantiobrunneus]
MDHESPGLEAYKPDLKPRPPTPAPFAPQGQSPESDGVKHKDKDAHMSKHLSLQFGQREATAALLRNGFAPHHSELWRYEQESPIAVEPHPADRYYYTRELKPARHTKPLNKPIEPEFKPDLEKISQEALHFIKSPEREAQLGDNGKLPPPKEFANGAGEQRVQPNNPPNLGEPPSSLSQFLISDPESRDSLPALRDPSSARSPDASSGTRLPPIQTHLSQLGPVLPPPNGPPTRTVRTPSYSLPPVTGVSPPLPRVEPSPREPCRLLVPPKIPPSPYSHRSPASSQTISVASSPISQQNYWRSSKPPVPYPYDPPSTASNKSPASSYPTPIDHASTGACEPGGFTPSSQGNLPPAQTGAFKCSHPGCTAPPFQTQYLLNSHANVHSQDRPHFCPVEGCSRGPGGKGFKRKNEMIRHGLVHNSPGYVCPFCPDQQHKYPRPDNLQRHVRVHHVDKNKDDPALRHVLSQRPEGSGRGRRRRINPQ